MFEMTFKLDCNCTYNVLSGVPIYAYSVSNLYVYIYSIYLNNVI